MMSADDIVNATWNQLVSQGIAKEDPPEGKDKAKQALKIIVQEIINEMIADGVIRLAIPPNTVVVGVTGSATPIYNTTEIILEGTGPNRGIVG
jgi:hypothetical protein